MKKIAYLSDSQELSESDVARSNALTAQLWLWLKRRERYWFQLLRGKSLVEKDRNTKYFHLMALMRKGKKTLGKLKVGNRMLTNLSVLKRK